MTHSAADLDIFYRLLDELSNRLGGTRRLNQCHGRMGWPQRGVYFFFEPGEARLDGTPRVVRVGTHALKNESKSTLWGRLLQHKGHAGGSSPGSGNHRGSIFRLHVGASLLCCNVELANEPAQGSWGKRQATTLAKVAEVSHEQRVSAHIGAMPFLWLPIDDPPGRDSDRSRVERGSIGLLSALSNPYTDAPSPTWLGNYSDRPAIVGSGLRNVDHTRDKPGTEVLDLLDHWIQKA